MERISVIATVFNRADTTVRAFRSLEAQEGLGTDFELEYFVVDDRSTDMTVRALEAEFSHRITIRSGSGDLFWSGGMAEAQEIAIQDDPDWLLWLNDDVELRSDAIRRVLGLAEARSEPTILVGAMRARSTSRTTYSGMVRTAIWPGSLAMVEPDDVPQELDAFHGNFVLVPRVIYKNLGSIDAKFQHAYGDIDYGLRARKAGFVSILAPGHFGYCDSNSDDGTWKDESLGAVARLRLLFGRKGYPLKSHVLYNRRHGGSLWMVFLVASYLKAIYRIVKPRPSSTK